MEHRVSNTLKQGRDILIDNNIDPREARLLLAYSMGILADDLIKYEECLEEQFNSFIECIKRRIAGEPYAYIVGEKEFMKLKFKVNKHTLIPREDTEILVQKAINIVGHMVHHHKQIKILDMCTGTGCIAISLAKYIQNAEVDAVDISEEALFVAKQNAELNNVRINFIHSDLFENVKDKYDMIVSNPPYIIADEIKKLQKEVQKEPIIALDGGIDGLDYYKEISKKAINYLKKDGDLLFEIGFDQGQAVSKILENDGYSNIEIIKDLSENDRVIIAKT